MTKKTPSRTPAVPHYFDVIISGAGPAGATCALFLARAGKNVLVLEKEAFPRDKVCADNKTWKCLDIVKELGLWKEFQKLPKAEIHGVYVESPSGNGLYTPLYTPDVKEKGPWYNVKRVEFDNLLASAAKKEKTITFREQCEVVAPIYEGKHAVGVRFRNESGKEEEAHARVVVGADGSASPIANAVGISPRIKGRYALNARAYFTGIKNTAPRCELYYWKGICPGYFWIFPVDKSTCNVGIGMRTEDIAKGKINLAEKIEEIIHDEKFAERFSKAKRVSEYKQWGLSVLGKLRRVTGDGFVLVGDAGVFAMTYSGEGVGPSMRSGKIAAQTILNAFKRSDFSAKSLSEFDARMREILAPEISGFRWLEFLLLNETVYDWVVKKAARNPELIELSSRMQNKYELSQQMVSPTTILKLLFS